MQTISFLKGLGLGLAAMYFLDPQHGRARRLRTMNGIENGLRDLTQDLSGRGQELAKQAKSETESTKITVRNARQDGMKELRKLDGVSEDLIKDAEDKIQVVTDKYVKMCDEHLKTKEAEIMKV